METKLVETRVETSHDMQMDKLALLWEKRHDEFSDDLTKREETSCCGIIPVQPK